MIPRVQLARSDPWQIDASFTFQSIITETSPEVLAIYRRTVTFHPSPSSFFASSFSPASCLLPPASSFSRSAILSFITFVYFSSSLFTLLFFWTHRVYRLFLYSRLIVCRSRSSRQISITMKLPLALAGSLLLGRALADVASIEIKVFLHTPTIYYCTLLYAADSDSGLQILLFQQWHRVVSQLSSPAYSEC